MPCYVMRLRVGLYIRLKFNAYKFESIRRQRKLSQLDVADLSGVSKRTIASIGQAVKGGAINGLNFHLNTISSLAKSLDVPPLSLIIESEAGTFNPNPEDIFIWSAIPALQEYDISTPPPQGNIFPTYYPTDK